MKIVEFKTSPATSRAFAPAQKQLFSEYSFDNVIVQPNEKRDDSLIVNFGFPGAAKGVAVGLSSDDAKALANAIYESLGRTIGILDV